MQTGILNKIIGQLAETASKDYKVKEGSVSHAHNNMEHILVCLPQKHWNMMFSNLLGEHNYGQNEGKEHKGEQVVRAYEDVRTCDVVSDVLNTVCVQIRIVAFAFTNSICQLFLHNPERFVWAGIHRVIWRVSVEEIADLTCCNGLKIDNFGDLLSHASQVELFGG